MARKVWTIEEVEALERRIRDKVGRKERLTCGEDTLWGAIRAGKSLTVRLVEEVDSLMDIDFDEQTDK